MKPQSGILKNPPRSARFLTFRFHPDADAKAALRLLGTIVPPPGAVIGLGLPLILAAGKKVEGLRGFPSLSGLGVSYPSTQEALWAYVPGEDPGQTLHLARGFFHSLGAGFSVEEDVLSYQYAEGRDLSGYEDGTENPKDEKAAQAALVPESAGLLSGSSFVAVQRWIHDLDKLDSMKPLERDHMIGRDRKSNEELADAPASAHVKRAAQESYSPPAFMLRRSMPWGNLRENGLYFVAFGKSLDPFEAVLKRMAGLEDGTPDALARFTRAVSGGYYWCPPMNGEWLDLKALG